MYRTDLSEIPNRKSSSYLTLNALGTFEYESSDNSHTDSETVIELPMVIWHNTEDAPRTPAEVFPNDKVVLWIGSYPIELGQEITVELKVSNKNSEQAKHIIQAEWRYNDYGRNNSYWTAIVGPFKAGERVEYRIMGVGPDGLHHTQIDSFSVADRRKRTRETNE